MVLQETYEAPQVLMLQMFGCSISALMAAAHTKAGVQGSMPLVPLKRHHLQQLPHKNADVSQCYEVSPLQQRGSQKSDPVPGGSGGSGSGAYWQAENTA